MKSVVFKSPMFCNGYSTYELRNNANIKAGLYINRQGVVVLVPKVMDSKHNKGLPIVVGGLPSILLGETLCGYLGPWVYMDSQSTVTLSNSEE